MKDILDEVADIGGAPFTHTHIRSTAVDFSIQIVQGICRFFIKNPEVWIFSLSNLILFHFALIFLTWTKHAINIF